MSGPAPHAPGGRARPWHAVPLRSPGAAEDNVTRMRNIVGRLRERVEDFQYVPPASGLTGYALQWTENGEQHEENQERLGWLCDWAERKWPA